MDTALRILVLEDETAHAEAIQRAFPGAEVGVASTLREYRELVAARLPHIAIVDLNLPDGRAMDVLTSPPQAGPFPVMVMTSHGSEQAAVEAMKAGALDYIVKSPEAFAGMPRTVERILREWRLLQEHQRVKEAIRESEEKLRAILDSSPFPVAVVDVQDSEIKFWSRSALALFGHTAATTPEWYQIAYPDPNYRRDVTERWKPFLETARHSNRAVNTGEYRITCSDGSVRICELHAAFVKDNLIVTFNDITERKRAEASLQAAHNKLEALWDVASLAEADVQTISDHILASIARMTDSQYGFYGFVSDDETVMTIHSWSGEAMRDCSMVDQPQQFPVCKSGVWAEAIRHRKPLILNDYAAAHAAKKGLPEGHVALTNLLVVPYFLRGRITAVAAVANRTADYEDDDARHITAFLEGAQAIVERCRAEEGLRQSQERLEAQFLELRQIYETSPVGLCVLDRDLRYVRINQRLADMNGKPIEHHLGRTVDELVPDLADKLKKLWKPVLEKGETLVDLEMEGTTAREPNMIRHWLSSWFPTRSASGEITGLMGAAFDITDRKRMEENLHTSEEQFRAIFELASVGMAQADPQTGRWLRVNEKMCAITGYSAEEMLTMRVPEITHPEDRQRDWDLFQRVVRGEAANYQLEKRYVRKDGTIAWVNVNMTVIRDAENRPVRTFATVEDVTERKRREQETALLESQLRQSQKLEAVGRLASGVAHDFNNLLAVISGHAELARQETAADHPALASLQTILQSVEQAAGVTTSLLTFSRKFDARLEQVVPAAVVEESGRLLQRLLPQSIELMVETAREPRVWMLVDRVQLKQVILNLAINARDAMPEGGHLRITCRPGPQRPSPGDTGEPTAVYIEVADTGTGMPPELVDRVFEPFFTTKPRGQGTGLGLSIVHGIVKAFGGAIEVKSEVGKGSTFTIILPCHEGEPEGKPAAVSPAVSRGHGETVLLADDNPQILDMLTRALESRGYAVTQAVDGEEMLSLWMKDRERIRLIIADNDMPKLTGLDSLRQIRKAGGKVPAILITGVVESEYRDRLDPDTVVLCKPFQIPELAERIHKMLDAHRGGPAS